MAVYNMTILSSIFFSILAQRNIVKNNDMNNYKMKTDSLLPITIIAIILISVAGLRFNVGADYWQYIMNYSLYKDNLWINIKTFNEPGINIIAKIGSFIYDDYAIMIYLASFITIGLSIKTIFDYSNFYMFSILLYIFIGCWTGSFNGIRQYLACAVLFAGHRFIYERKFWKYATVVFFVSIFHISAMIMFFMYFIALNRINFKNILLLSLGAMFALYSYEIIFTFLDNVFDRNLIFSTYANRSVTILRTLVAIVPSVVALLIYYKKEIDKEKTFYINLLIIHSVAMLAASNSAYLARFGIYTTIYSTIAIPKIFNFRNKNVNNIITITILLLYALFFYYSIMFDNNLNKWKWIWDR